MTVVIGIGTEGRGDDVAGLLVARALRRLAPAGVAVFENGGDPAALMAAWEGAAEVVAVDAVRTGAAAGTLHRLDGAGLSALTGRGGWSSHGLSLREALELAGALGRAPRRLRLVGIEGQRFGVGSAPSPGVLAAVPAAVEAALAASVVGV